jgi:hypothetical protein
VRHVAEPFGRDRANPPSLRDLRVFVASCEGLPDDTRVNIDKGSLDESGRHSCTFSVRIMEAVDAG